jgi:hypothetical protein
LTAQVASDVFGGLRERAERGTALPIPAQPSTPRGEGGGKRRLVLHSAFLVAEADFESFHQCLNEMAAEVGKGGFSFELAGPLPPYHFARVE